VTPRWTSSNAEIHEGDAAEVLRAMPENSVDCIVTSPPYWALRDYGTATWHGGDPECDHRRGWRPRAARTRATETSRMAQGGATSEAQDAAVATYRETCARCGARRVDAQLGLEATPEEYIDRLVAIFAECRRVLKPSGTAWINIGDTWANSNKQTGRSEDAADLERQRRQYPGAGSSLKRTLALNERTAIAATYGGGVKEKDAVGVPWMLAFAMRADGWWWRQPIIWSKPNAMPESAKDRCTNSFEVVHLMTKSAVYFFDWWAVAEPLTDSSVERLAQDVAAQVGSDRVPGKTNGNMKAVGGYGGVRRRRDVWSIPTEGSEWDHYATFPERLVEPCVMAGSSSRGVCPECGAPHRRVVEASGGAIGMSWTTDDMRERGIRRSTNATHDGSYQREDMGWLPGCAHGHEPVQAMVLDPFAGTGTTLAVAVKLGRRAVGVELSRDHCATIERRVAAAEMERSRGGEGALVAAAVSDMGPLWEPR
jgi:DNA modification methylase